MRSALALLALASLGCGMGRSKMLVPPAARPDAATSPLLPDSAPLPDAIPTDTRPRLPDGPPGPDVLPPQPDVRRLSDGPPFVIPDAAPDGRVADLPTDGLRPPPPDGLPPVRPDVPPEGPPVVRPDARFDGPPPVAPEVRPDGPPFIVPEVRPDGPPSITPDVPPEVLPPPPPDVQPDGRRPRPDTRPPQDCAAGAACTADCTATCSGIGTMICTCAAGVLSCGDCDLPPITISPEPCPDNPSRTECPTSGLACIVFGSSGAIDGACMCLARGSSGALRWSCLLR